MFSSTGKLKSAVALINQLETPKFRKLLSRISQKLHLKDERTFSEEEEEKLQTAFGLSSQELELVIETSEFFLHQAAYHAAKPQVLSQQLTQLELIEDKVTALVDAWTNCARMVIEKLRKRTLAPKQLENITWRMNLQMAQSSQGRMKEPNAMFQLTVADDQSTNKEKIRMQFNHQELYAFYNQLEAIQTQLDHLN